MNKLEALKKAFEAQGMSSMLPRLAHSSWCTTQIGSAYEPSKEHLDELYTSHVAPASQTGAPGNSAKAEGYMKLWYSLTAELGEKVFPFEDWIKVNPESPRWAEWIEEAIMIENIYRSNPEKWLMDFRSKLSNSEKN
jgi:hypothetical protein